MYEKQSSTVGALYVENFTVIRSMSKTKGIPMLECSSHRFLVVPKKTNSADGAIVMQVQQLMTKLRTSLASAKLG